jgi:hypothetical protein
MDFIRIIVFYTTFNNISDIVVVSFIGRGTRVPGENHLHAATND